MKKQSAVDYIISNLDFENPLNWQTVFEEAKVIEKQNALDLNTEILINNLSDLFYNTKEIAIIQNEANKLYDINYNQK